ncbi:MAG TPA: S8 family serine peptidase, partial [Actinomycetota bacterium]|nr:S8 family serine peptidase [Actinomycetota bacterium]
HPALARSQHTQPVKTPKPPHATLADANGNHIADALDQRLARANGPSQHDVVVTFSDRSDMVNARRSVGLGHISTTFSLIDGFVAHLTDGQINAMAHHAGVIRVEPNVAVHAFDDATNNDFGVTGARAAFGVTGSGTQICIPDSGVDLGHEQLDSKAPIGWLDLVNGKANPYDDFGHGTFVASVAVGDGVGSGPIADTMKGVAPDAALSAVKVIDNTGNGDDALEVQGIQWCAARPAVDVISLSLGSDLPSDGLDAISQAVDAAVAGGKIVVAAAGNSGDVPGSITAPGSAKTAITVGAAAEWSAPSSYPYASKGVYLAPFSSRGPTVDNRIKPDIVAPGVTIGAAQSGTVSTYVVESGTSMATPYVAGVALLLRQLQPTWQQSDVRAAIESTALDAGPAGKDDDWGAGLLDAYGAVAEADGLSGSTPFPTHKYWTGSVPDGGSWSKTFTLGPGDLGAPIAATVTTDGSVTCTIDLGPPLGCFQYSWLPDLEAELDGPSGFAVARSTCPAGSSECTYGRQETLHIRPKKAGTYTIRVYPAADGDGSGGSFSIDLFTGPVGGATGLVLHVGDLDGSGTTVSTTKWRAKATITVHDALHNAIAGVTVSGAWTGNLGASCVTTQNGKCSVSHQFAQKKTSVQFAVANLQASGDTYGASANHDPDTDSNGTTITVTRP